MTTFLISIYNSIIRFLTKQDVKNFFDKIADFGNKVYEKTIGLMNNMPGAIKGLLTVCILCLVVLGAIKLLKMSFKIFGVILVIIIFIAIVGIMLRS